MTGKLIAHSGLRISELRRPQSHLSPQSTIRNPQSKGFTLLELMIVISIIVILAAVALPQFQRAIVHARETVLRDDLFQMRKMIDQYAADKGKLPQSLNELVTERYLREIPEDPITQQRDWDEVQGNDPSAADGGSGVIDVRSKAEGVGTDGTAYNQW